MCSCLDITLHAICPAWVIQGMAMACRLRASSADDIGAGAVVDGQCWRWLARHWLLLQVFLTMPVDGAIVEA